jgi:hypothetical protein
MTSGRPWQGDVQVKLMIKPKAAGFSFPEPALAAANEDHG